MAEAAAVVSLVSAITQLIELGAKVIHRLDEFSHAVDDVPKSFRALKAQLPLLQDVLCRIQAQCQRQAISPSSANVLQPHIKECADQLDTLNKHLNNALGPAQLSDFRRRLQALKSMMYDTKVQKCMTELDSGIRLLTLHQSTTSVDASFALCEKLAALGLETPVPTKKNFNVGLNLGNAPQIEPSLFVGREREIESLSQWLTESTKNQKVISIVGTGGLGKTQLSLAFAERRRDCFTSIFWFNAKDEGSLKQSFLDVYSAISSYDTGAQDSADCLEDHQIICRVRSWLSEAENSNWLLIFDNYDCPNIPCARDPDGYDVRKYFPFRSHGSILITTRSRRLTFTRKLKLTHLLDSTEAVLLLSKRAERDVALDDVYVLALVKRLGCLPLALATAGDFLRQTNMSLQSYLQSYEQHYDDLKEDQVELMEYEERTLFSTWSISLEQVRKQDPNAAQFLCLFAYFGNEELWYDLFNIDLGEDVPWFNHVTSNEARFNRTIGLLHDYCLIEIAGDTYSLHTCVHDWLRYGLNSMGDHLFELIALRCIAANVHSEEEHGHWRYNQRLLPHALRLGCPKFDPTILSSGSTALLARDLYKMAVLWHSQGRWPQTVFFCHQAMTTLETSDITQNGLRLDIEDCVASTYWSQGLSKEAGEVYAKMLKEKTAVYGQDHFSTLETQSRLALTFSALGMSEQALVLATPVLQGLFESLGKPITLVCKAAETLGLLCHRECKLEWAEYLYSLVLVAQTNSSGTGDTSHLLGILYNLALCQHQMGRTTRAEALYRACLARQETSLPPDCPMTASTLRGLGTLLAARGQVREAQALFDRAYKGCEKWLDPSHPARIEAALGAARFYKHNNQLSAANEILVNAYHSLEKHYQELGGPHDSAKPSEELMKILLAEIVDVGQKPQGL